MSENIICIQRFSNFKKAVSQMKAFIEKENINKFEVLRLLDCFEYTFELAWKTMKDFLENEGFEINSPRKAIQTAFQIEFITDGHVWIDDLNKRGLITNTYDQNKVSEAEMESIGKKLTEITNIWNDYIFYAIGFLQTLYIQQDLVDELRVIFKLPSSNSENIKEIRSLRNELVGHPISRDRKNKLISTVFWGDKVSFNNINYIRYNEGEFENSENISINIDYIIDSHKKYLSDSFDEILKKEKKMIKDYSKG